MDPNNVPHLMEDESNSDEQVDNAATTMGEDLSSSSRPGVMWSESTRTGDIGVAQEDEGVNPLTHLRSLDDIMKDVKGMKRPKSTRTLVHDNTPNFPRPLLRPRFPNADAGKVTTTRRGFTTTGFGADAPSLSPRDRSSRRRPVFDFSEGRNTRHGSIIS